MDRIFSNEERDKVYNEIWEEPVSIVAKRYGISDTALRKRCIKLNIPIPPRGYWEKVRSGQKIKKPSLPKVFGNLGYVVRDSIIKYRYNNKELSDEELRQLEELGLLTNETKALIIKKCNNTKVKRQLRNPHNLIIEHQKEMELRRETEKDLKEKSMRFGFYAGRDLKYTNFKSALPIHVSEKNTNRAYRILDALFRTIEELDGHISVEPYIGQDVAHIRVVQHSFNFKLQEEVTKKKNKTKSQNSINKQAILEISFWRESSFGKDLAQNIKYKDLFEMPLESQLSKIIYSLFVIDNKLSVMEEIRSRELEKRWEEEKRQQHLENMRKEELEKVLNLERIVSDWDTAQKIRCFSDSLEKKMTELVDEFEKEKIKQCVMWMRDKADWFDPLKSKEDNLLGKKHDIVKIFKSLITK